MGLVGLSALICGIGIQAVVVDSRLILKSTDNKMLPLTDKQIGNLSTVYDAFAILIALGTEGKMVAKTPQEERQYPDAQIIVVPASYATLLLIQKSLEAVAASGKDSTQYYPKIAELLHQKQMIEKKELSRQFVEYMNASMYLLAEPLVMAGLRTLLLVVDAAYPGIIKSSDEQLVDQRIQELMRKNNLPPLDQRILELLFGRFKF